MLSFTTLASAALLLATASHAHFELEYPPLSGAFDDDDEANAPCGGSLPDFTNATDFHVGGEPIATLSTHPQANFIYRITSDETASGNWTEIYPIFQQTGIGEFCIPGVTVNSSWVGTKAVLSVVGNLVDGVLYQCAAVNFVSGTATTLPEKCTNGSGTSGSFTSDTTLAALVGDSASTTSGSSSSSASSTSSASTTANAAGAMYGSQGMQGLYTFMVVGAMTVVGAALMI